MPLDKDSVAGFTFESAGLVALADLPNISQRTALMGTSWYTDILFLCPGIHTQQSAGKVNDGEYPVVANMNSGYVFRIENQATVFYLQGLGKPGHLATVHVEPSLQNKHHSYPLHDYFTLPSLLYYVGILLTVACFIIVGLVHDYWALAVLCMLVTARALNTLVVKRRSVVGWKGQVEGPDVKGDLLVLMSQDRWIRIRGATDDLKRVTSGQWLRDETVFEGAMSGSATLLVFLAAAVATNASTVSSLCLAVLLLVSVGLLGACNALTNDLHMFGCRVHMPGKPQKYVRRLDLAKEMIDEHGGRRDWAIGMGLVLPEQGEEPILAKV